jgi:hypothetical protein
MVQSKQSQPLRFGDRVEAIGYPDLKGVQPIVLNGLYRLVATNNPTASALMTATNTLPLRLTEQIRDLSPEEAGRHLPVNLRAIVTWSDSSTPFAYVLDASGGIRVDNPKWDEPDTAKPGTIVLLEGVTSEGAFVPVVTNAVLRRTGWWKVEEQTPGDPRTGAHRSGRGQLGGNARICPGCDANQRSDAFRSEHVERRIPGVDSGLASIRFA